MITRGHLIVVLAVLVAGCGGDSGDSEHESPPAVATATDTAPAATPAPSATPVVFAAGELDPSFGTGGIALVTTTGAPGFRRHSLRVLADGGVELIVLDRTATATTVRVVRVLPNGTRIDDENVGVATEPVFTAFGSNGDVWVLDGAAPPLRLSRFARSAGVAVETSSALVALSFAADLVPLADGGMLAVGATDRAASGLQRFDARGIADATFGGGPPLPDGLALGPRGMGGSDGGQTQFRTAAVADGGRILVTGTHYEGISFTPSVTVFDAAGRLAVFGNRGSVTLGTIGIGMVIAPAPDGGAVVGLDDGLARIDSRGGRDPAYSARVGDPNAANAYTAFTIAASGALTGVGATSRGDIAPIVYRLLPDGTGDPRFGGTGQVTTRFDLYRAQNTGYFAFESLPAGRLTAAGTVCRQPDACDVVVARYGNVAD